MVTEAVPGVRSATFGIWAAVGSRDETPGLAGASHYLEHLLFKGTRRRDALAIAAEIDAVGGEANAFTAKEYTCFYARVLDVDLPLAIDVTCDMVTSSRVLARDVDGERSVVLEEIAMHDDDPGDVVHDAFAAAVFGTTPLGRPVLGTVESIEGISRTGVHGFYRRRYTAPSLVVCAAGALEHGAVVRAVLAAFDSADMLAGDATPAPLRPTRAATRLPRPTGNLLLQSDTEQAHVVLGGPGTARTDERRTALAVLHNVLGGGPSSRLFQEVRERRGLAYSVYSFASAYADTGLWGVSAACTPQRVPEVLAICREQIAAVVAHGVTPGELARAQGQLRGTLVLGMEDTEARMHRLGKSELAYGELLSVEQLLARIDAVTLTDVAEVAADVLSGPLTVAAVGDLDDAAIAA